MALIGSINSPNDFGFKNRIINGAMIIAQRGTTTTLAANSYGFGLDRFQVFNLGAATCSVIQSTNVPSSTNGFINSHQVDVTLADASIAAADLYMIRHVIEGLNVTDLAWGTANAKPITLSFWVSSSKTGTHFVSFKNSAQDRVYAASYTISVANTWEFKTITVTGDQSGTWLTTNGTGIQVVWALAIGTDYHTPTANVWAAGDHYSTSAQVNVMDNAANNFYITGVQVEKGSTATAFDYRSYDTELNLCLRYYLHIYMAAGNVHYMIMLMPTNPGTSNFGFIPLTTPMRIPNPAFVLYPAYDTGSDWNLNNAIVNYPFTGVPTIVSGSAGISPSSIGINVQVSTAMNLGYPTFFYNNTGTNGYIALNAEL